MPAFTLAKVAELHAFAVTYEIQLARGRNDPARVAEKLQQALLLLQELEKNGSSGTDLHGYRHHLAHHLTQVGQHDLAPPLLDANLSTGGHSGNGYAWLMHAAAVWQVMLADRIRPSHIARQLALSRNHVHYWMRRYVAPGVSGVLRDAPRPGRRNGSRPNRSPPLSTRP